MQVRTHIYDMFEKKNCSICTSSTLSPDRRGILGDEHTVALTRTLKSQESRGTALKGQKSEYSLDYRTSSVHSPIGD